MVQFWLFPGSILLNTAFTTVAHLLESSVCNNVIWKKPSSFPAVFVRNIQNRCMWGSLSNTSFPGTYLAQITRTAQNPFIRQNVLLSPCRVILLICHKVMSDGWTSCSMEVGGSTSLGGMTSTLSVLRCSGKQHWDSYPYFWGHFLQEDWKKKKRGAGMTFQRGIEFSLNFNFKRVSIRDRFSYT